MMMPFIRSVAFNIGYYFCLAFASATCVFLIPLPPIVLIKATKYCCKAILFLMQKIAKIEIEVRGLENIPQGAAIIASKHQSAMETFFFPTILPQTAYILKRELLMIPLFGWCLWRSGCIGIDRSAGAAAMKKMLAGCNKSLATGHQVVVFPEGTRTMPEASPKYQPGIALLYKNCDAPVIPVALNSGMFWRKRAFVKLSGKIIVEFFPPMEKGLSKTEFMQKLQDTIENGGKKIAEETRHYLA